MAALRVVLDTNVVLSALLFGGGPAARVRAGWQSGRFVPLASAAHGNKPSWALALPSRPRAWAWASSWGALAL